MKGLKEELLATGDAASEITYAGYLREGEFRVEDPDGCTLMIAQSGPYTPWSLRSLKLVEIGVWGRMAEFTAHGHDLSFVVKRMRDHVMQYQRRGPDGAITIREMKLRIAVQLLIGKIRKVLQSPVTGLLLEANCVGDCRKIDRTAIDVTQSLKNADPETLAVENVNDLFLDGVEAKRGKFFCTGLRRQGRKMLEKQAQAGMSPLMKFADTIDREHDYSSSRDTSCYSRVTL